MWPGYGHLALYDNDSLRVILHCRLDKSGYTHFNKCVDNFFRFSQTRLFLRGHLPALPPCEINLADRGLGTNHQMTLLRVNVSMHGHAHDS